MSGQKYIPPDGPPLGSVWHHIATQANVCVTDVIDRKGGTTVKAMREDGRLVDVRLSDWGPAYRPGPATL